MPRVIQLTLLVILAAAAIVPHPASAAPRPGSRRVVLVTLDGMRWQEIFRGPDARILADPKMVSDDFKDAIKASWVDVADPAEALTPFLHDVVARQGVLYGNRDRGQCAEVTNDMWFSYPGYNEILTGRADPALNFNEKIYNKNVTVLEWLNRQPGFTGHVEAVGNWDVFPYIVNDKRSGVPVNRAMGKTYPTETLTARYGLEAAQKDDPYVLWVAFGDTDEYGHAGDYYDYLAAANRADEFIRLLWTTLQMDPAYHGHTTLIVTTDHGRGNDAHSWMEHSSQHYLASVPTYLPAYTKTGIVGSNQIWIAAIGPGVRPGALPAPPQCAYQNQVAASIVTALGLDWQSFDHAAGAPLSFVGEP